MLNFNKEYFSLEKERTAYPTGYKNKDNLEVYGRKKFLTIAGVEEYTAHVFKIPSDYYSINAGNIDFSNYPDGIWNDYISVKIIQFEPYFAPEINFSSMGDITPENLEKLKKIITEHILNLEKKIVEEYLFIDEGVAENKEFPNLKDNEFWVRKHGVIVGVNLKYLEDDYKALKKKLEDDFEKFYNETFSTLKAELEKYYKGLLEKAIKDLTDLKNELMLELTEKIEDAVKYIAEQHHVGTLTENETVINIPEDFVLSERLRVWVNGLLLTKDNDYTLNVEGRTVTLKFSYKFDVDYHLTDNLPPTYIQELIDDFYNNAEEKKKDFNDNATEKTNAFNKNAETKTNEFNTNSENKTTEYNKNHEDKLKAYNDNDTKKLEAYNSNHTEKMKVYDDNDKTKITAYNENHDAKLKAYNDNATQKTSDFNKNVTLKTDEAKKNIDTYVTETAKPEIDSYIEETTKPAINSYVDNTVKININNYVEETSKAEINTHTEKKITEAEKAVETAKNEAIKDFNTNASKKTTSFDTNATNKTNDFNTNVTNKIEEFDRYVAENEENLKGETGKNGMSIRVFKEALTPNSQANWIEGFVTPLEGIAVGDTIIDKNGLVFQITGIGYINKSNEELMPLESIKVFGVGEQLGNIKGPAGKNGTNGVNGKNLEFTWNGTQLGVRVEGEEEYQYVELKGATGAVGANGKGLLFNWNGTQLGIKVEGEADYTYTDLKGATGAVGPKGADGTNGADGIGIKDVALKGQDESGGNIYTITLTNGATKEFTAPRGAVGPQGERGPAGANGTDATVTAGTGIEKSGTSISVKYGNTAGTACEGNDARLSDARKANGGNADTATKLKTARTINGVAFDGSANITVADGTKLPASGGTISGNVTVTGNSVTNGSSSCKSLIINGWTVTITD